MEPDETQRAAAISLEPNLLVIAPPGCGKTELLALRAQALIPSLRSNQKILTLTFTNRAKANLTERLRRLLGAQRVNRYISVHNFHGHAAEIVLAHGATLGLEQSQLQLPGTKTLGKALRALSSDPGANRAAAELLANVKRGPLNDDEVLQVVEQAGDALARQVEINRAASHQLHYDDLLRYAQCLLRVEAISNLYQQHYGAVLVDEFQDLSEQQLEVALRSCTSLRTFAGDPLQGIYSWAGAAPAEVEAALRATCGEPVQLTVSYRSSPAVLGLLNGVSARMGAPPLRAHDSSAWPDGGVSAAVTFDGYEDEAAAITRVCKRILATDPATSIGVISRSGWRRAEIDKAVLASGIPSRRWELAIEDPAILDRLRTAVAAMPHDISFESARGRIVATIDPSDVDTIEQIGEAFDLLEAGSPTSVRSALGQFRVRADTAAIGPGVHLLNAHTGKGQQFDWVFVPGLEEKHLPDRRSVSGDLLAEEQRVLLVMLSRARHGLIVTRCKTAKGRNGSYAVNQSRWWEELVRTAATSRSQLIAHLDSHYPGGK